MGAAVGVPNIFAKFTPKDKNAEVPMSKYARTSTIRLSVLFCLICGRFCTAQSGESVESVLKKRKGRLRWEGFEEKDFKPGMKE